uniref:G protein-coupled receptor n=1 Tax=Acrobeloides nanus TaxID=290746 RepID=A0A914BYI4_9BILA
MYFIEEGMNHTGAGLIGLSDRIDVYVIAFDLFLLAGGGYSIIIWCSANILLHMKNNMLIVTPKVREMNKQLNKALFAQALGPLAVCVIPMLTYVYCIVTKADAVPMIIILGFSLVWIPVVNPLLTILFVTPYKMAILKCTFLFSTRIGHDDIQHDVI